MSYLLEGYKIEKSKLEKIVHNQQYCLRECSRCKLIFQEMVPDDDFQVLLYDEIIDWDKSYQKYLERRKNKKYMEILRKGIVGGLSLVNKKSEEITSLDFGAGWGIASDIICTLTGNHLAGEISEKRVKKIAERGMNCVDINTIPDASVDYIYTEQVLEHLVDLNNFLKIFSRKLSPGGILRIGVPNGIGVVDLVGERPWLPARPRQWSLNPVAPLEHINCFDIRVFGNLANYYDLEHVHVDGSGRLFSNILRRMPITLQSHAENLVFRAIGKKLGLAQYWRKAV